MDQESRIKYFDKKKKEEPYSYKDIYYQGGNKKLPVYRIDTEYLIYNRWNGRISSLVKSYEKEKGIDLDASDTRCIELIENFLQISNEAANKAT